MLRCFTTTCLEETKGDVKKKEALQEYYIKCNHIGHLTRLSIKKGVATGAQCILMGIAPQQGSHRDNKGYTVIPHYVAKYHKTTVRRIIDRCREIILSLMNSLTVFCFLCRGMDILRGFVCRKRNEKNSKSKM